MRGGFYLFWHPDREGESQLVHSLNLALALEACVFPDDGRLKWHKSTERPDNLTQVAAIEGDLELIDKAVDHWPETDAEAKPVSRALACFKHAFKRSYRKPEAKALSDIVALAREKFGEAIPKEDEEDLEAVDGEEHQPEEALADDGEAREERVHSSGDAEENPGGEGDHGVRLGRPSWSNQERPVQEDERRPPMEALGDPRDREVFGVPARRRDESISGDVSPEGDGD